MYLPLVYRKAQFIYYDVEGIFTLHMFTDKFFRITCCLCFFLLNNNTIAGDLPDIKEHPRKLAMFD